MPVIEVENTENHKVGLWKITESVAELRYQTNTQVTGLEQRDLHLLSSRILLQHLSGNPELQWSKTDLGKPYLVDDEGYISLSHSGKYSAAIIGNEPVGIDIEKMDDRILRIAPKFVNEFERPALKDRNIMNHYFVWCVKECIFKWYGLGGVDFRKHLFVDLKSLTSETIQAEMIKNETRVKFDCKYSIPEPDYLLVWIEKAHRGMI